MMAATADPSGPFKPDPATAAAFLAWWFERCTRGQIEIGWLTPGTRALNNFRRFNLRDVDAAAAFAAEQNAVAGANVYFRACTVSPAFGKTTDEAFLQAPGPWVDHDTQAAIAALSANAMPIKPTGWVITGRSPHMRAQTYWHATEVITDASLIRDMNKRLCAAFAGDTTATNPSRLMRLAGSIAWPVKQGRQTEMTAFQQPTDGRRTFIPVAALDASLPSLAPQPAPPTAASDEPRPPLPPGATGWAVQALRRECDAIRFAADGGKHQALNKAAYSIGGLVAGGMLDADEALTALRAALESIRHRCDDFGHAEATLAGSFRDGRAAPRPGPSAWTGIDFGSEEPAHDPETGEIWGDAPPPKPAPKERPGLRLLTMAEVEAMPPPQWLIHGVLPRAGLVIPYGPPKAGKTFIVTAWALHVAAGLEWCGRPVTQGAVVYVVGEGLGGFAARLAVMRETYGIPADAPFYVVPRAVNFRDDEAVKQLVAAIEAAMPPGTAPVLIVLDTLARAMPGVDENSAQEVGLVIARCDAVKEHFGATICPVHHTGKDTERGMRGSNALLGAVDASYLIQRAGKNVVRLKNDAMKDAEEFTDMLFDMEQVHVGLRSSLVPRLRDTSQGRPEDPDKPTAEQIRSNVIVALKGTGSMPFRRVAEAIGMVSGNARQELQSLIPLGKQDAIAITRNGSTTLLWRSIDGDHKTAAQLIHAETTHADE
jgi:hypothetical protein